MAVLCILFMVLLGQRHVQSRHCQIVCARMALRIFWPQGASGPGFLIGAWLGADTAVVCSVQAGEDDRVIGEAVAPGAVPQLPRPGLWLSVRTSPVRLLQRSRDGQVLQPTAVLVLCYESLGGSLPCGPLLEAALPVLDPKSERRERSDGDGQEEQEEIEEQELAREEQEHGHGLRSALLARATSRLRALRKLQLGGAFADVAAGCFCLWLTQESPTAIHRQAYGKLADLVVWLMGAPADFKLNKELTSFAGSLFLAMFSLWDKCASHVPDIAVDALLAFAWLCAATGGVSFLVALLVDLLAVLSLPLFVAYSGTCLCWKMATRSLYTLGLLFQGRKYNVLRSRVDHHNFSLDQLLVGVILLSIVVFLLPSLFMFCVCFSAAWLLVSAPRSALALWPSGGLAAPASGIVTVASIERSGDSPVPHWLLHIRCEKKGETTNDLRGGGRSACFS